MMPGAGSATRRSVSCLVLVAALEFYLDDPFWESHS
jgi:hypothetical protein